MTDPLAPPDAPESTLRRLPTQEAINIAAQCWCDDETRMIVMDPPLAFAFAQRVQSLLDEGNEAAVAMNEENDRHIARIAELDALLAAHAQERQALTEQVNGANQRIEVIQAAWKKRSDEHDSAIRGAGSVIEHTAGKLRSAEARATTAERERDAAERRLLWAQGSSEELDDLCRSIVSWTECDRHERGPGPAGGYSARVEKAHRLFDLAIALREAHARLQRELDATRETKACVHGHTERKVGCVSCVLLFGSERQPLRPASPPAAPPTPEPDKV